MALAVESQSGIGIDSQVFECHPMMLAQNCAVASSGKHNGLGQDVGLASLLAMPGSFHACELVVGELVFVVNNKRVLSAEVDGSCSSVGAAAVVGLTTRVV